MGIWDELRLTAVKLFHLNATGTPPGTANETRCSYDMGLANAVTQLGGAVRSKGAEKLKEYPDPDRREKIGRIICNVGKFAVDSAVSESLKGVSGGIHLYKIVKEGIKDQPPLLNSNENKKPDLTVAMEEMQARMEKMEEEMNNIKQKSKISNQSAKESKPLKEFPDEPVKGSVPLRTDPKRVFIRSRL